MRLLSAAAAGLRAATASWRTAAPTSPYEAARSSRRLAKWQPTAAHINAILQCHGPRLRDRTRDLVRNNGYIRSAVETFCANAVGPGIVPNSMSSQKAALRQLWQDWTDFADADGLTDLYGQQDMIVQGMLEAGEIFARRRPRRPEDGLPVPLQVQLIEADQLPIEDNRILPTGNEVRCGIEFDRIGRRVAYHFLRRHPGDTTAVLAGFDMRETVRVPASEVAHIYRPRRPGQIRGEPEFVAALVKAFIFDAYDDAELDRKKVAALFAAFITEELPEDAPAGGDPMAEDEDDGADGTRNLYLEPATIQKLRAGESITFSAPADVGGSYEAFQYRVLLAICAALGVPYQAVTGDLTKVSFASIRSGTVEFRQRLKRFQHNVLVYQFCRPVWRWFLDAAVLSGATDMPGYARDPLPWRRVLWQPPKLAWVDPLKDIQAEVMAIEKGLKSRQMSILEAGDDPEEVDRQRAEDMEREKRLGLRSAPADPSTMLGHNGGPPLDEDEERPDREDDRAARGVA